MSNIYAGFKQSLRTAGILNFRSNEESGEAWFLNSYLSPLNSPIVIDVGAHAGGYLTSVLEACPTARVLAFEPQPASFSRLRTTFGDRATLFEMALGDETGDVAIFDRADKAAGSQHSSLYQEVIEDLHHQGATQQKVPIRRLDDVLRERGVTETIALLKIDTEGHELAVLRGAAETLAAGRFDAIQFEFNEMNVISRVFFKDFWDLLSERYNLLRLMGNGAIQHTRYVPWFCEVFAFHNVVAIKKTLPPLPNVSPV